MQELDAGFLSVEQERASKGANKGKVLGDADFEAVFGMTKEEFLRQPMSKQREQKKKHFF